MSVPRNRLAQSPDDANHDRLPIGVHTLTEFEFCSRAGLVAHESRCEDTGQESGGVALDYLPLYELREINRQLNLLFDRIWSWLFVALAVGLVTVVSMLLISWLFAISGVVAMLIVGIPVCRLGARVLILSDRKKAAENATPRVPNDDSPLDEMIGWWEIQRAGFDASSYKETLVDSKVGLGGKPRKVLRRDDLTIPVFFRNEGPLKRQHYLRIAAYCQLIEHCELVRSPYGLVVEKGTYVAHVLKNTKQAQDALRKALRAAREIIREEAASGEPPLPPKSPGHCQHCPIGFPRRYRPGETELVCGEMKIPVHRLRATERGSVYHSHCGDRFKWKPPHKLVVGKGLKETG